MILGYWVTHWQFARLFTLSKNDQRKISFMLDVDSPHYSVIHSENKIMSISQGHHIVFISLVWFSELLVYRRPESFDNLISPDLFRYFKTAERTKKQKVKDDLLIWKQFILIVSPSSRLGTAFVCTVLLYFLGAKIATAAEGLVRAILLGASTAGSMGGQWREKAAEFWQHNKPAGVREAFHLTEPLSRCAPARCLPPPVLPDF